MQILFILFAIWLAAEAFKVALAWITVNLGNIIWSLLVSIVIASFIRKCMSNNSRRESTLASKQNKNPHIQQAVAEKDRIQPRTCQIAPKTSYSNSIYNPENYIGLGTSDAWKKYRDLAAMEFKKTGQRPRNPPTLWRPGDRVNWMSQQIKPRIPSTSTKEETSETRTNNQDKLNKLQQTSQEKILDELLAEAQGSLESIKQIKSPNKQQTDKDFKR